MASGIRAPCVAEPDPALLVADHTSAAKPEALPPLTTFATRLM